LMRVKGTTVVEKKAGASSTAPGWAVVHHLRPDGGASSEVAALGIHAPQWHGEAMTTNNAKRHV